MYYDDFNNDNTNEMFAIVGKGDGDNFSEAEIRFISDEAENCVKEDIDGFETTLCCGVCPALKLEKS